MYLIDTSFSENSSKKQNNLSLLVPLLCDNGTDMMMCEKSKLGVVMSKLSYKKLFKMLIDVEMKNSELMNKARISKSTFYKIKNGENVTTDVLLRICDVLECDISDIVECINDYSEGK